MPIITNLEDKILQLVRSNQYQWFTVGVNLGGVSGVEGGSGIPLGGFVGQLIQSKVTFDTSEAISLDIPASGQSLVHNLNRIRYWIDQKGGTLLVQDEGVEVASGITTLDFVGAPVDVTLSGGKVIVTISGTGEGSGETVKVSSDDTVANYLDNKVTVALPITKVVNNPAGNENLEIGFDGDLDDLSDVSIITAISGQVLAYTDAWLNLSLAAAGISAIGHSHIETDITDLEHDAVKLQGTDVSVISPSNNDILVYSAGGEYVPSGLSGGSSTFLDLTDTPADYSGYGGYSAVVNVGEDALEFIDVSGGGSDSFEAKVSSNDTTEAFLEDKIVAGTNVTITTLDDGGNETLEITSTASGGGGGSVQIDDEGVVLTSGVSSIDFVGSQITATTDGDDVTVTISGIMVDAPEFVGCRTYRTTNYTTISGNTGWQNVDWQAEVYDTDSMWTTGGGHIMPSDGYYHTYGQVTFSGGLPTANAMQVGLFDGSFPIGMAYNGYYSSSDQIITFPIAADWLYSTSDNVNIKLVNHQGTEAILMSGIENSFLCTHKILAVVADAEETPVCCNVYVTGYDNDPADDTWTELDWDAERYDTDTMYPGVDDNTIVINTAGYYNIVLNLMWHGLDETPFPIAQRIVLNDTNVLALTYDMSVDNNAARAEGCALLTSCDYELAVDDTITVDIWHNRGSTLSDGIRPGDGSSFITLHRIGPA